MKQMSEDARCISVEFESRRKIEEDLMAILKDENVGVVGICGMGGVGKTTLAHKIKNRVIQEQVFGESMMAVAGQYADERKIQRQIAEPLGLQLLGWNLAPRAEKLHTRLMNEEGRILIILDDVWEYLRLEEDLGIPCRTKKCTVLLTSRNRDVLTRMDAQTSVVETLTEEEAWSFFKEKLQGTVADNQNNLLSSLPRKVASECYGLPLALEVVAGELKGNKNVSIWEDVLRQLRNSNPEDMPRGLKRVYAPLKLSYDYLAGREANSTYGYLATEKAKSIFLLCSLFPVDFNIPLKDLTAYAMGLRMFERIGDLEQVRDRTEALVAMLKNRFLLSEGCDGRYVRMNGFIRLVAISIASNEERLIKCGYNSTWISTDLGERIENSKMSTFPNLRLLLIDNSDDKELQVNDIPFEGMRELNVLSVNSDCSLTSLQHTTELLQNLHTLVLKNCRSFKTLCAVGELINLEVLYCRDCGSIEELPMEIGRLYQLKLLHISNCESLKTIAAGVISRLTRLEELTLLLGSSECPQMERFSSGSLTSPISFKNLKSIEITSWSMLELVLWNENDTNRCRITFPKLEKLHLHDFLWFAPLCKGIEFPLLTRVEIVECPNLKTLVSETEIDETCSGDINHDADGSLHLVFKAKDVTISVDGNKGLSESFPRDQTNANIDELTADTFASDFSNLRFLLINNGPFSKVFPFSFKILESMRKLDVLSTAHFTLRSQLPQTIHLLKNLHTLILESCESLEDISIVGQLLSLEVLFCRGCGSIKELPAEIGRLSQLKLLHIFSCESLKAIAAGVISRLTSLEELTLIRSFKKWESKVKEGENAALCELNFLSFLTTLRIEIEDVSLAAEQINLPSPLPEFNIKIGNPTTSFHTSPSYGREMQLVLGSEVIPGEWIHQLARTAESLVLEGEGSSKLVPQGEGSSKMVPQGEGSSKLVPLVPEFQSSKRLIFQSAKMTRLSVGPTTVFPVLEFLCLKDIDDLEEIHGDGDDGDDGINSDGDNGPISPDSFKNLQEIILVRLPKLQRLWNETPHFCNLSSICIAKCHSLHSLFASKRPRTYDFRLRRVKIRSNSMLEQVVLENEEENVQSRRRMGKLQYLDLCDLSRFTSLFRGIDSFEFTFDRKLGWRIESK